MKAQENIVSYTEVTSDVRITVYPQYIADESAPANRIYTHAYTVVIENYGPKTVQLLRRHWEVFSGGGLLTDVKGDGVIGEQPVIEPGEVYKYTSGSIIEDPVGHMHGSYTFIDCESGVEFNVAIPHFDLLYPELLH